MRMIQVRRMVGGVLVGLLAVSAGGCGDRAKDNVAVSFTGGNLTVEDLEAHRRIMSRQRMFRDHPERLTPEFVTEHAVNMEMIIAKGLKEKLQQDPRLRAEIHGFMSDLFLKVMQEKLVPDIDGKAFTDAEVRAYYEKNKAGYRTPVQYGISVIKGKDADALGKLRARILAGEITFADAAARYSTDEKSRKKKGYIGLWALDRLPPGLRDDLEKMSLNQISEVKKSKDNFYLVRLLQKTEPHQYTFEEKAAYVRNDLLYSRYREEWRKTYDRLRKEFNVKEHEKALKRFSDVKPAPATAPVQAPAKAPAGGA